MESLHVYCAGPLFNKSERDEMTAIADELVRAGHSVYLPHRDGMEFRLVSDVLVDRGWNREVAGQFLHEAIFALDVYQLAVACDAMVWNMNGRVPDEGAVSEAAMAWSLGKPLIAYRDDVRSLIAGRTNPLLAGLVDFTTVHEVCHIPAALVVETERTRIRPIELEWLSPKMKAACERGAQLWSVLKSENAFGENLLIADCVTTLFAPASVHKLETTSR